MDNRFRYRVHYLLLMTSVAYAATTHAAGLGFEGLFDLDLQQLSNITVSSVSNTDETLRDAPSTTIVLTRDQLLFRGYRNLSQIFDDLPGMDVVRPYGDVYFANYWRGIRNNLGSPFLLLLDGVVQNDLYYNSAEVMVAMPVNAVDRIEVVYGPASVVYGANAFAGVINIITRHASPEKGVHSSGEIRAGSFGTRIGDVFASVAGEEGRASLAARYDVGQMDDRNNDAYEWTRDQYYGDPALWGGFATHGDLGSYDSPHRNSALDLRVGRGNTTFVAQHFLVNSGYGSEYPADRAQNHASWQRLSEMVYLTHRQTFNDSLEGNTLLGYRNTGLDKPSDFLEAFDVVTDDGVERRLAYSLWNIVNRSTFVSQDMSWALSDQWHFTGGVKAEWKDLQKAASVHYGAGVAPDEADPATYPYPGWPSNDTVNNNRENTTDKSLYALATWRLPGHLFESDTHLLNAGFRVDDNSIFGSETSLRGGWVSHYGDLTVKLMAVGDSYQTPTPRVMFSGWAGSGSDPDLEPETARTTELSAEYVQPLYMVLVSAYQMDSANAIINFPSGAANAGEARTQGVDVHFKRRFDLPNGEWLRMTVYYSYLDVEELTASDMVTLYSPFADTSRHKAHFTMLWPFADGWWLSFRSRYYEDRETIETNPAERVKGYSTADANLTYKYSAKDPLRWTLSVENLFNRRYFHPGVRQADAGFSQGQFDDDGVWHGSDGYFNSLLPQEGRGVFLSVQWDQ